MSTFQSLKSLSRAMFLGFSRDRGALFFTILFPLMFPVVFGGVFGHRTTSKVEVLEVGRASVLDQAVARDPGGLGEVLKATGASDRAAALRKVEKGDADAVVEQRGGELVVPYSATDQVKSGTVRGLMDSLVQSANLSASGRPPPRTR